MWGALACQQLVVQSVTEGFRPLTAQGRGAQIPLAEPTVEIGPLTMPMDVKPKEFDSSPISQTLIQTADAPLRARERGGAHRLFSDIVGVIDSGRKPTHLATNAWINLYKFVRDERPQRSRPRGGDCSSRGRQFEINGI